MTTKHTPKGLKHTRQNVLIEVCRENHIYAKDMARLEPMCESSKAEKQKARLSEPVLSAGESKSKGNGLKTEQGLSKDTAENANAAASQSQDFSQLTTSTVMGESNASLESAVGDFINGLLKTTSLEKITDCFVSIVIALADNSENVHTRNNAKLIAASPDMLAALKLADSVFEALTSHEAYKGSLTESVIKAAIAKAEGGQ